MLILENKLYKELNKRKINWDIVEKIIKENTEFINEFDGENCSLSECYHCFYQKGKEALKLTNLFLDNGFDLSANDGKNGASCLTGLCWSLHDQYILEIAELLLQRGADSTVCIDDEDERGVLDSIDWRSGDWMTGEYENANLFEAYYELVDRAQKGKEYAGIRAFRNAVGSVVQSVEKIKYHRDMAKGNAIRTSYLLCCCDGKTVVASDFVEFMVNPYAKEDVIEVVDVTDQFNRIIGAKIKGLRFQSNSQARLNFDNGISLFVGGKAAFGNEELEDWLSIVESKRPELPPIGTPIKRICFPGQVIHGENFQYYEESSLILEFAEEAYSLYSHEQHEYAVSTIRVERFSKEMIKKIKRCLDLHSLVLEEIHFKGEAIEWIRISCEEGMFYINSDGFTSVGFYLAPFEINNPGEISTWTKGLIPLKFPGTEDGRY